MRTSRRLVQVRKRSLMLIAQVVLFTVTGCGPSVPRFAAHPGADPASAPSASNAFHQLEGVASFYADEFNGRPTANGETFDMNSLTAAHRTLPFNTMVRVVDVGTTKSVVVRINDRGPFKDNRVIDLSFAAAKELGIVGPGTASVRLEILQLGLP